MRRQQSHLRDASPLALAGVLGLGILIFFALPMDPPFRPVLVLVVGAVGVAALLFRRSRLARWLSLLPATLAIGFGAAAFETQRLGDHLLDAPAYTVEITGRVDQVIWRGDGPRFVVRGITTDREELGSLQSAQIKWRGLEAGEQARGLLGQSVRWTVTLLPVRGAILPGGFDFRRQAFFRGLSAYGYSLGAPVVVGQRAGSITETWRQTLRARFLVGLQGDAGGLATALVVGLRGDLSEAAEAQIRAAGLAHILAISGLHVGMVAGALFFLVRLLGGLLPGMSLRLQTHRIAAIVAVLGAVLYFSVSGGSVPTQRATIVVGLAMAAILLSRRPFSLRSVGFAALVVLLLQPSSLVTASFQMSFAAVIGLIVAFRFQDSRQAPNSAPPRRALNYVLGLMASSLIATAATGVFALYHFQQLSLLGIIANIIAVPLTALFIMPLLMLAALLTPLGGEGPVLWVVQFGLDGLLLLARLVSQLEGGVITTRDWPPLALLCAGLALWGGALLVRPLTLLALVPLAIALGLALNHRLPTVIADRGEGLLAFSDGAPFLSFGERPGTVQLVSASGFAREQLERHFNARAQACPSRTCTLGGYLWATDSAQTAAVLCASLPDGQVITLAAAPRGSCTREQAIDLRQLPRSGSRSFTLDPTGRVTDFRVHDRRINRFWTMEPEL